MSPRIHPLVKIIALATLALLYLPMIAVAVYSVNNSRYGMVWRGFTLDWYRKLFDNPYILEATRNTLVLAVVSTAVATPLGVLLGLGMVRFPWPPWWRRWLEFIVYLPVVTPDIIFAAALIVALGILRALSTLFNPGLLSMILAHITFQIAFVALVVIGRLEVIGPHRRGGGPRPLLQLPRPVAPRAPPADDARHFRRRDAGLHPLPRRFRNQLFHRRPDLHHPADLHLLLGAPRRHPGDSRTFHFNFSADCSTGIRTRTAHPTPKGQTMKTILTSLLLAACLMLGACEQKEPAPEPAQAPETSKAKETPKAAEPAKSAQTTQTQAAAPAAPGKELNVYMYSEYIGPELIERFKKETGLAVRISPYETTEEMMAKMQNAGGTSQYDVVVVSDHAIPVMTRLKLLQPLDAAKLPNLKNIDKQFTTAPYDPGNKFSVPYQWGTMGIMYRKDKIPQLDPSWTIFFDPAKQPGPFVLIDSMRDMLGAALLTAGKSISTKTPDDLKKAGELVLAAKKSPKCLGFEGGVGGKNKVTAGQAVMAIVYNGDAVRAMDEEKNAAFALPKEGTEIWVDAMTVPAQAPNAAAAYQFINFILEAKAGAELSNFNRYATPNAASMPFITEADRKNPAIYPSAEDMKKMQYLEDVGDATRLYDEVWTTVKSR